MSNVTLEGRTVELPRWPTALMAVFAFLATLSLLQGVFDIVIPSMTGARPFGLLFQMTGWLGPGFFAAYVFTHNLGIACLVPGYGFVAVRLEKKPSNRKHVATLLAGAVVVALLFGLEFMFQASDRFDLRLVLPLFVVEACGVLLLVVPSARELRRIIPTRVYEWSLVTPLRKLLAPFIASILVLALASAYETWIVLYS